ncbi:hypothetical protein JVT61DRAFT_10078 [Boletus reticuloceps]|uniref:Uncharacterized protein n=1 Tax=Boletus reticuloceps TaxID=495285 RepID=A0A8I2YX18_9AGAM|nr:hypothetical protein JVT61DRAFT_10078 [Boletus reticuloceps]
MYDADYPNRLKKLQNYAASPELPSLLQWKPAEAGHALVWKTTKELFVGVAVVQVYNYRLNCGPNGNYINPDVGKFVRSKFQFYSGRPSDSNFSEDYLKLFSNLEKLQQEIAVTKSRRDMLFVDASGKMLRFAKAIFMEREKPLKRSPDVRYYEDVVNATEENQEDLGDTIDDETNNWPVEEKYKEALNEIKYTHRVLPLRVYKDSEYVEPRNVNNLLRNSVVEVLFSIHHTFLRSQVPAHDTFRANIEQIIIHKQQQTFDETSYSKTSVRSGPISADTFNVKHQREDENESESRPQKIQSAKGKGTTIL